MKGIIVFCLIISFFSCKEKIFRPEYVNLEIVDKEIISNKNNIITYKLTNNTKQKLFFILDEDDLNSAIKFNLKDLNDTLFFGKKGKILFDIATSKNIKPINTVKNIEIVSNANINCDYDIEELKKLKSKIIQLKLPVIDGDANLSNSIRKNSFILYPNQSKYFLSNLYLSNQNDSIRNLNSEIIFNANLDYNFNLIYMLNKKVILKSIPKYKLSELKENNIFIYDGKLISNKIPIRFVN